MERDTINERREIEDRALTLGDERSKIKRQLAKNTSEMITFVNTAVHHIPLEHLARYLQVGRATLYRWLDDEHRGSPRKNPNQDRGDDA